MTITDLASTAQALVAGGKGILAADETPGTLTRRLDALKIESTPDSRRAYREMFFTTPGIAEFISGVIMQDETIRQKSSTGIALADLLAQQGIIPGIKVDNGAKSLAGSPGENITEGLDGLRERLKEYRDMGARFAKWRAVIAVSDTLPSATCVKVNAHALARYAALCQEQGVVPIVEPEVLMDGAHTIERCEEVTGTCLARGFQRAFRSEGLSRRHVAQTQHGHLRYQMRQAGVRQRSRACYSALSTPACAGRGSRDRLLVRRPKPSRRHRASQRHQSARGTKALDAQFFVWARITGRSAQGLAGKERKSESWPASFLSSGQVRQRSRAGQIYASPWKASASGSIGSKINHEGPSTKERMRKRISARQRDKPSQEKEFYMNERTHGNRTLCGASRQGNLKHKKWREQWKIH